MRIQKKNTFFSQLINLKQKGSLVEHIEDFQRLNIKVNDIPEEYRIDFLWMGLHLKSLQSYVLAWKVHPMLVLL